MSALSPVPDSPDTPSPHFVLYDRPDPLDAILGWACVLGLLLLSTLIGLACASLLYLLGDRDKTAPAKMAMFMDNKLAAMETGCTEVSRQESFNPKPQATSYQRRAISFACPTGDPDIPVEVVYWSTLTIVPPQGEPVPERILENSP